MSFAGFWVKQRGKLGSLGKLVDHAKKSRASIGRRLAQRLLSSACQSLLGRKVQTNCRLRTGTFKLLQCRRRALLLLMSAPCFEHLLLQRSANNNLKLRICCWSKTFPLRVLTAPFKTTALISTQGLEYILNILHLCHDLSRGFLC